MLKRRLIPKLQMKKSERGRMVLVTTRRFDEVTEIGDPVSQARIYEAQAADELIFLYLDGRTDGLAPLRDVLELAAAEIFMPITVGGGVKSVDDFSSLLTAGADKVSINSAALVNPDLITAAADRFGSQCVVLSIDYKDTAAGPQVFRDGGLTLTGMHPVEWAQDGERLGAGEIMLTSIDRDGSRTGLDIAMTEAVKTMVGIPVITAGGCGRAAHFVEGFRAGGADAVAAGTYFCFKDENPMQTRSQIRNSGIPIRLHT